MESVLSNAEREELEAALAAAEPYTEEEIQILDGEEDFDRMRATIAQKLLEMEEKKKEQHGH